MIKKLSKRQIEIRKKLILSIADKDQFGLSLQQIADIFSHKITKDGVYKLTLKGRINNN